jgi:hypothetical protein
VDELKVKVNYHPLKGWLENMCLEGTLLFCLSLIRSYYHSPNCSACLS